ncbi:MAG TPA: hypothetical protein VJN88_12515 [Ktedonobacterales bacterium]|nr:hypothetical protein [Ktedonobacterales bacterium]
MSEYQRYEFMTGDRPLSRDQLDEVKKLSSHIEASSTHALIEYHWGDYKHDPLDTLYRYFDGFLYWANWGAPQLAFRFPHALVPTDLLADFGMDLDEVVTFTQRAGYDILDIHFGEMESPDEWTEYELGSLMPIRDEVMDGDPRALYIVWLAEQQESGSYDDEEEYEIAVPPTPPAFGALTSAQKALADLLQLPPELLGAAARHSATPTPSQSDDLTPMLESLPLDRRNDYLARLARNEPGLSRLLLNELRALRPTPAPPAGERVTYATLRAESEGIKGEMERARREREQQARMRRLRQIHDHQDEHWRRITEAAERGSGAGYDEATRLLVELRAVADHFGETRPFQNRFYSWVQPHLRRPALAKRLLAQRFTLPDG